MNDFQKENLKYCTATDLAFKFACPSGKMKRDCKKIARRLSRRKLYYNLYLTMEKNPERVGDNK